MNSGYDLVQHLGFFPVFFIGLTMIMIIMIMNIIISDFHEIDRYMIVNKYDNLHSKLFIGPIPYIIL